MKQTKLLLLAIASLVVGVFQPSANASLIYTNFTLPSNTPYTGEFQIDSNALWDIAQLASPGGNDYKYAYQAFRVNVTGVYTMGMTDGLYDPLMILYSGTTTFPGNPATGAIALNDDGDWSSDGSNYFFDTQILNPFAVPDGYGSYFPSWLPMIKEQTLTAGTDYLVAISSFSAQGFNGEPNAILSQVGTFTLPSSFFIGGPAAVSLYGAESASVPEPGQVAASIMLLAGIGGYVWLKRRKQKATA